jgi:hypothetical protein
LVLLIALPVAWLASEFQQRRALRIALGTCCLVLSFGVAGLAGSLQMFNANAWFGSATKELIDTTVTELEAGNTASVLSALKGLQQRYQPTYENRARYDKLVEEAVREMKTAPQRPRAAAP